MRGMYASLELDAAKLRRAAEESQVLATDVADYLVSKGMPFREAHGVAARLSGYAADAGRTLPELGLEEYRRFSDLFEADVLDISVDSSLAARDVPGGAAPGRVRRALEAAERTLRAEADG